jgi:cell wall-associated NlpC family hydrolase
MGPSVESFHYSRISREWGVLRLLASLGTHRPAPTGAHLIVEPEPDGLDLSHAPARLSSLERRLLTHRRTHGSQRLWRAVFALPLDVIEVPDALFTVRAMDGFALEVPTPGLQLTVDQLAARVQLSQRVPQVRRSASARARQKAVALATAVAVTAGLTPAAALAAAGTMSVARAVPHSIKLTHLFSNPAQSGHAKTKAAQATPAQPTRACATPTGSGAVAYAAARVAGHTMRVHCPTPTSTTTPTSTRTPGHHKHTKPTRHRATHSHPSGGVAVAPVTPQPAPTSTPTHPVTTLSPTAPAISVPENWTGTVAADPALTGAVNNLSGLLSNGNRPPSFLIPIYMEAGHRFGVPWEVLAAINAIETDYGQNLNTSSAGAVGWMQFEPSTWAQYGMAVDGASEPNPYDPRDAIFSAAKYLAAAGAREDVAKAVYSYNHAGWYVDEVMSRAHAIASNAQYERMTVKHGTFSVDFATGVKKTPTVHYSSGVLSHFDRLIAAANMVSAANFPYLYGGGHEQPARFAPFDCSGSVSYVMQQAGYTVPTTVSGDIPMWKFPAGPGTVTVFYNSWHTFMRVGNRYFGTSGFARPGGGGAGWFDVDKLPADYLAKFNEVHVPGLGVNSFAPGAVYSPVYVPKPKRASSTLDIRASMQLSTLGASPGAS